MLLKVLGLMNGRVSSRSLPTGWRYECLEGLSLASLVPKTTSTERLEPFGPLQLPAAYASRQWPWPQLPCRREARACAVRHGDLHKSV